MSESKNESKIGNEIVKQVIERHGKDIIEAVLGIITGLFRKKPKPPVVVPEYVSGPGPKPITAPPENTPPGQPGREIARVKLEVQKAEYPRDPGNMYEDPMGIVRRGDNFNFGSVLWLNLTAYDDEGEEWRGDAIIEADLEYRTKHVITRNGAVSYIEGRGGDEGKPNEWKQQEDAGATFGSRAWLDSVGFNVRTVFRKEGEYDVVGYVGGIESNRLTIKVS